MVPYLISSNLEPLNFMLLTSCQVKSFSKLSWKFSTKSSELTLCEILVTSLISFIMIKNSRGPRTLSCGTPLRTFDFFDFSLLTITCWNLSDYSRSIFQFYHWFQSFSFFSTEDHDQPYQRLSRNPSRLHPRCPHPPWAQITSQSAGAIVRHMTFSVWTDVEHHWTCHGLLTLQSNISLPPFP